MRIKWVIITALVSLACSNAAEKPVLMHKFILPDGYRGAFKVIEDKKSGQAVNPVDGVAKIIVPADGIVALKSTKSLTRWHKAIAVYRGGGTLPLGIGALPDRMAVAFFNLWSEANGAIYYFVGTKAEFEKLQKGSPWKADDYLPKG